LTSQPGLIPASLLIHKLRKMEAATLSGDPLQGNQIAPIVVLKGYSGPPAVSIWAYSALSPAQPTLLPHHSQRNGGGIRKKRAQPQTFPAVTISGLDSEMGLRGQEGRLEGFCYYLRVGFRDGSERGGGKVRGFLLLSQGWIQRWV
jgi:hypothetical protein